jgi:RimJ/RimL family protein N-acetyltransferase
MALKSRLTSLILVILLALSISTSAQASFLASCFQAVKELSGFGKPVKSRFSFSTERTTVEPVQKSDYSDAMDLLSNPEVAQMNNYILEMPDVQFLGAVEAGKNVMKSGYLEMTIRDKYTDKYLGLVYGSWLNTNESVIGYLLHPKFWNQGIATEVVAAMTKMIFSHFPLIDRINAETFRENIGSQRVLIKNGFTLQPKLKFIAGTGSNGINVYRPSYMMTYSLDRKK